MKKFVAGFLCCAILLSSVTVFAESVTKTIDAIFGQVKLVVNGVAVDKETLLYNGTTYVPLRAAAEVLGMDVTWDGNTNTAGLYDKEAEPKNETVTPAPVPESKVMFKNSGEVEKYIEDTHKSFSYTTTETDGLDVIKKEKTVQMDHAYVVWDKPNEISTIQIWCDSSLRFMALDKDKAGYDAAKIYMKKIADDIITKLPGINLSKVYFVYGWYTYPTLEIDFNSVNYCRWKMVNGVFEWDPSSNDIKMQ